jgi:predicted transcriptional regulator
MSVEAMKAAMQQWKISEKHLASRTGLDRRTVKRYLETGETRSLATEQAIVDAFRELVRERSEDTVSPGEPQKATG